MAGVIDALFDQYERGALTRRHLLQALTAMALPAGVLADNAAPATPIVQGLGINHVGLVVADTERSFAFYQTLFGVTKGWPLVKAGTGFHLDLPNGYISVDSAAERKSAITHFSVAIDHIDMDSAKILAERVNAALPDAKARAAFQANDGVSTVNLTDPDGFHVQISPASGR